MKRSINAEAGLGNAAVYLCLQSGNTFYDFVGLAWVTPITADCKIFGTERATPSSAESRYEFDFTPPSGVWDIEVFDTTGNWLGSDDTSRDEIKAKTDQLTFTTPNKVDATSAATFVLPALQGHVYTAIAVQQRKLTIVQGDTPRITFDLDADYTGWAVRFGAKVAAGDLAYAIGPVTGAWTTAASGIGYVDLSAANTATAGSYKAEIEITSGSSVMTAIKFDLTVAAQVVVPPAP